LTSSIYTKNNKKKEKKDKNDGHALRHYGIKNHKRNAIEVMQQRKQRWPCLSALWHQKRKSQMKKAATQTIANSP